MSTLLLLILPPLVILTLIIMAAIWLTNKLADRFVGQKHRLLEEIMDTRKMPVAWESQGVKARQKSLRKLDKLIEYAQRTPLVADEETRQVLLATLAEVRADWTASERDELE